MSGINRIARHTADSVNVHDDPTGIVAMISSLSYSIWKELAELELEADGECAQELAKRRSKCDEWLRDHLYDISLNSIELHNGAEILEDWSIRQARMKWKTFLWRILLWQSHLKEREAVFSARKELFERMSKIFREVSKWEMARDDCREVE